MTNHTGKRIQQLLRGYWILILVLLFGFLSIYTSYPSYGAPAAQSTPDVNTVPKPVKTPTPENTPFPTPTTVSDNAGDDESDDNQGATPPEDENQGGDSQAGDTSAGDSNSNEPATGASSGDAGTDNSSATTDNAQQPPTGVTGVVTAVTLNLRKGPGATTNVIDTLFLNDPVAILARNQTGDWLYICCGSRTKFAGWVSKQFVSVNNQAMALIPLFESTNNQASATAPTANTSNKPAAGTLVLEMRPLASSVWQGQNVAIQFVIRNRSNQAFTGIQLRNDLPDEMAVVNAQISNQGKVSYSGVRQSGPVMTINWPTVQANSQVTATVMVQIATNVVDGALIDSLAVVKTSQGAEALAGITLAMPPVALPQFREP